MKKDKENKDKNLILKEEALDYNYENYYTYEEFKDMEFPDELGIPELIDGIICFRGNPTVKHDLIAQEILVQFHNY